MHAKCTIENYIPNYPRDGEDNKGVEPEAPERAHVTRGHGTSVPHEVATSDHHGHVSNPELEEQVRQMQRIQAAPEGGDDGRQRNVHVEAKGPTPAQGEHVEEEWIDGQRHPTCQEDDAAQPLHGLATWVDHAAERTQSGPAGCPGCGSG